MARRFRRGGQIVSSDAETAEIDSRCDHGPVRLNHVALTVRDRARSAAFYREHFGLTDPVHDDEHLLILGSAQGSLLALSEGTPPADLGSFHFGFQVSSGEEVRAARERMRAAGVPETEWQDDGNFLRVQVADPDGYPVDLYVH